MGVSTCSVCVCVCACVCVCVCNKHLLVRSVGSSVRLLDEVSMATSSLSTNPWRTLLNMSFCE